MNLILCIETGTEVCSVALSSNGSLLALRESGEGRNHATNLAVYIQEILDEHSLDCSDLSAVAVSMGPGSYTGLRIGSSMAKGICYSEGIPLIAVSSLEAMAVGALQDIEVGLIDIDNPEDYIFAPMIDARRMEVYTQLFMRGVEPLTDIAAEIITEDSFSDYQDKNFFLFGNGAEKCKDILKVKSVTVGKVLASAQNLTKIAYDKFMKEEFSDIAYFEPLYLKDFVSTTKKRDLLEVVKKKR